MRTNQNPFTIEPLLCCIWAISCFSVVENLLPPSSRTIFKFREFSYALLGRCFIFVVPCGCGSLFLFSLFLCSSLVLTVYTYSYVLLFRNKEAKGESVAPEQHETASLFERYMKSRYATTYTFGSFASRGRYTNGGSRVEGHLKFPARMLHSPSHSPFWRVNPRLVLLVLSLRRALHALCCSRYTRWWARLATC